MEPASNPILSLLKLARASSDEQFKALLVEQRHFPDVVAPAAFRAMLRELKPIRFGLSWGFMRRGGKTGAFWFLNDFGALGTPDAVAKRITGALAAEGFSTETRTGSDTSVLEMTRQDGSLRQACKIERISRYTGTRDARAGGYLIHEAELQEKSQALTVQQAIAAWPALACAELPDPFKAYLYPLAASEVSQGGTWTQYYDWTATMEAGPNKPAKVLDDMKLLVEQHGWVLDREDNGTLTYFLEKTKAPVVFLSIEKGGDVQFRVQPRM